MLTYWTRLNLALDNLLHIPRDLLLLALRLWIAWIFFRSGLIKFQSWDVTLQLFAYEYAVPFLPPAWAAVMATAAELVLPPLIVAGFLTRPAALALLILNFVAAISYPDISIAGIKDHQIWGLALIWLCLLGAGRVSCDHTLTTWQRAHR